MLKRQRILIQFPIRERPVKFGDTFNKYVELAHDFDSMIVNIVVDDDDSLMLESKELLSVKRRDNVYLTLVKTRTKIAACNEIKFYSDNWDILLLASDDMIPIKKGYDTIIKEKMRQHFPDDDGCLWFYDGYCRNVCTQAILTRKYFNRLGYIYNPDYTSEWCDNEYTMVAEKLGKMAKFLEPSDCIIKHENPIWTKEQEDELFKKNRDNKDYLIFEQRRPSNFGL